VPVESVGGIVLGDEVEHDVRAVDVDHVEEGPAADCFEDGEIVPIERLRSRGRSVDRLFEFLAEFAQFDQATVLQGRFAGDAQALFEQLIEAFPKKRLDLRPYGPSLTTLLGPGALGVGVYEGF